MALIRLPVCRGSNVFYCIYLLNLSTNLSVEANSVDPDQTVPTLFVEDASKIYQQMTETEDIFYDWRFKS